MRKLSEPAPDCKLEITTRRLTMLAGASLMAPAVLAIQAVRGEQLDIPVIVGSSVVLSVLVLIRMEGLIRNLKKTLAEREALQIQLEYRALHDPLTGLPNRALFTDRLQVALSKTSRHGGAVAVLFLDLDSFKQVNDSLGHNAGDKLLREISGRLAACVRSHDTLARLGGDEFVLLLVDVDQRYTADVAQRMIETAKIPHIIDGHRAQVSASIGIFLGQGGNNPDGLLRAADAAMYHAKRSGREKYTFFSELPMAEAQSS
jgi:diguanylate cyclase (GGDEF)-like protein